MFWLRRSSSRLIMEDTKSQTKPHAHSQPRVRGAVRGSIVWLFVPFHNYRDLLFRVWLVIFFGVCGIVHLSVQRRAPAVTGFLCSWRKSLQCSESDGPQPSFSSNVFPIVCHSITPPGASNKLSRPVSIQLKNCKTLQFNFPGAGCPIFTLSSVGRSVCHRLLSASNFASMDIWRRRLQPVKVCGRVQIRSCLFHLFRYLDTKWDLS